ncbi:helicase-related protein [Dictyobacter formicarum]|uniref:RNA helicase n=1 Tax=Dictyobacter formicarum TaxID=2778368 RepID=A0ABQ3VQ92_9CHLR|nr:helicase-related protein [Dictyobacter formicarum]GHO88027.1 RNA helicase [Dictyobacter formicarum]
MLLHEIRAGMLIKGLLPGKIVTIINVVFHGSIGAEVAYKDASGQLGSELIYAESAQALEVVSDQLPWSFDADGTLFRLVSEAYRIHLAYLFDPLLAVHTSLIDPLPHQITAVYEAMLRKQPLRYLLADDPGAGKTIMTGLLIKELMIRGDLHRCLIVAPGNLVEQWQDELCDKFHLVFDTLTNDRIEASSTGNVFTDIPLCIARLDKLSRDERVQHILQQTEWDLVVVDEAHKMSATFFGGEIKYTKRYQLGQLLGKIARHFVLLTATPHNGKEEDFQLFLRLLDEDRFEGRFRTGVHKVDVSDLMRHLVKEQLYKFDATPLFPERLAYTLNYQLSDIEEELYQEVTDYVRREFNRADALGNNGRKGTVGFALTTLQRRLASSPEAIYQSLRRRRERLEQRLREERQSKHDDHANIAFAHNLPLLTEEELDDLDDMPVAELEATEDSVVDQASAARTIAELQAEINILKRLESLALRVRRSGLDRKWEELASLLQNNAEMFDAQHHRLKLVIFTEHRDTLNYLTERISTMLGHEGAVVTIHGGMKREERSRVQQAFTQDKDVSVLIATDAAGEGINLQRAHLMVNYDLPWNPNRLEQRFGRIHRIGQTEVCHLWNLVAAQTREGEVFQTLLNKLEEEREALGGQIFDVLGKVLFDQRPLRDLMVEAIRYGDRPDVRARLHQAVDNALDRQHLQTLLEEEALAREVMDVARVHQIRAEMERAAARRLQPHFINSFFIDALKRLGGKYYKRENQRYEITYVPQVLRNSRLLNERRATILRHYERVVFEKELIHVPGKPHASLIAPGHPLLDATIDVVLQQYQDLLKQGTVLVDQKDMGETTRVLFYLEHTIQDARIDANGQRHPVSRQLQFVELNERGEITPAGYAPFLDYRPPKDEEREFITQLRQASWLNSSLEEQARTYAIGHLVPRHLEEVKERREEQIDKTEAAVRERLVKEISYWSNRSVELRLKEAAGKTNTHLNSQKARQTAEELSNRLEKRLQELQQERRLSPLPPNVIGGLLVVPLGLLNTLRGLQPEEQELLHAHETERVEQLAMQAVMDAERRLGYISRDVSADKCGYDIESSIPNSGRLRFIEVKGRAKGATTVTITRNEIMTGLNKPEDFILAVVIVDGEQTTSYYITRPFHSEPDFNATSVNYDLSGLLNKGVIPE